MPTVVKSKAAEEGGVTMLTLDEKAYILETVERQVTKGQRPLTHCVRALADKLGKNEVTIWRYLKRMRDTTQISRAYLRASAYSLVKRVVAKADVDQAIELLQNPTIGVLEAPVKGQTGGGLFISVSADNCGAVNIGMETDRRPKLAPDPLDLTLEDYEVLDAALPESRIAPCPTFDPSAE